jgi:hypothetical protein
VFNCSGSQVPLLQHKSKNQKNKKRNSCLEDNKKSLFACMLSVDDIVNNTPIQIPPLCQLIVLYAQQFNFQLQKQALVQHSKNHEICDIGAYGNNVMFHLNDNDDKTFIKLNHDPLSKWIRIYNCNHFNRQFFYPTSKTSFVC